MSKQVDKAQYDNHTLAQENASLVRALGGSRGSAGGRGGVAGGGVWSAGGENGAANADLQVALIKIKVTSSHRIARLKLRDSHV